MSNGGPLEGYRVLELGNLIVAPTAAKIFAEFGAEVIKVERPHSGDEVRRWRLFRGDNSMLWYTLGRNKKSITLDLGRPRGRELALRLVEKVDVVLENFRPGTLEKWNLGPEDLRKLNPDPPWCASPATARAVRTETAPDSEASPRPGGAYATSRDTRGCLRLAWA
jgi:crotonobetainyl-CoA:carnitine CoA-transferase CaiB-like acyl-CoA transferase